MTDDKFLLLKMHAWSNGLSDEAVREISEQCELVRCDSGQLLHRANEPIDSVYFVVHGRLKQSLIDIRGNVLLERYQTPGGQVGALAAASGEPSPIQIEAVEPTTLLGLKYQTAFELTRRHSAFRQSLSRMVAESVSSTLMREYRPKLPAIMAIVHQSPATRPLSRRLLERLHDLGQRPLVVTDQAEWLPMDDIPHYCLIQNGRRISETQIRQKLNELPDRKPIVFDVDSATESDRLPNLIEVSDKVFWCVTPDLWKHAIAQLAEIERRAPAWRDKINIVWLLPGSSPWAPLAPELKTVAVRDFKLSFDEPLEHRSRVMVNGLERIVHEMRGVRIGLALGGGAARGMAHLGVLKAFEEQGISVDMIAGTSSGAMTGVVFASGMKPEYAIERFIHDLTPPWILRHLHNGGYWYLLTKYRLGQFDAMLRKYLHESRLEQMPIPIRSITVDLVSGQPIVRREGDAVHAILESINLPVLSKPINRDGSSLVDGGIINNVPANVLVSEGCNFVIAVSVTAQMKAEFASNRPDTPTSKMKSASMLQTIMRTYIVQNVNMNSVGVQPADFVIQPDVSEFDITEFMRADEISAIGEKSALQSMPQLKQLLSRVDDKLFTGS